MLLALEALEVPAALVAVIVNVYDVLGSRPVTEMGDVVPVAVIPPGLDVTVYPVIAEPPLEVGAVNSTVAVVDPVFVAVPIVGASGATEGVTSTEVDAAEVPIALTALR